MDIQTWFFSDKNEKSDPLKLHLKQMMDVSRVSMYRNDCYMNALVPSSFYFVFLTVVGALPLRSRLLFQSSRTSGIAGLKISWLNRKQDRNSKVFS